MKLEINQSLFEKYSKLIKERYNSENISEYVEQLIEIELRKFCFTGYEIDGLTKTKTRFQLQRDINHSLWGKGWNDFSVFKNRYLCIDIDNFKHFLDFQGLTEGDKVLMKIGEQLKEKYDGLNIYRIAGDDFVVELNNFPFSALKIDFDVKIKYSIVNVAIQRNERRHHASGVLMLNFEKGIIESSEQVTKIECKYPENI